MCVPLLQYSLAVAALYVLLFARGLADTSVGVAKLSQLGGLSGAARALGDGEHARFCAPTLA
jgi:hypothetical protein